MNAHGFINLKKTAINPWANSSPVKKIKIQIGLIAGYFFHIRPKLL
jgi:hypothetical protein